MDGKESSDAVYESMAEVQFYLISNYRDALRRGEKSEAKSCLQAARCFSANDPNVTCEVYTMAKSDGDVPEAARCFSNIFSNLFTSTNKRIYTNDLSIVRDQMREELRILLTELKLHHIKLRSPGAPAALALTPTVAVRPSVITGPGSMIATDNGLSLNMQLSNRPENNSNKSRSLFYQQLFNNLPEVTRKGVLEFSIENCDEPFERCRLAMLYISIFDDGLVEQGRQLLKTLMTMSGSSETGNAEGNAGSDSITTRRYAKGLLVLDVIPLLLSKIPLDKLEVDIIDLFEKAFSFYVEHCLEVSATEFEVGQMHDGVKKSIAARIMGIEYKSAVEEATEDNLLATLNILGEKYLETMSDSELKVKLKDFHSIISSDVPNKSEKIIELHDELKTIEDIPLEVLTEIFKDDSSQTLAAVPPPQPKGRGRPKKVQPPVACSLDDETKANLRTQSRQVLFIFYSIMGYYLSRVSKYLRLTRSRIVLKFDNPLAECLESEIAGKGSSQRQSRSKASSHEAASNAAKKIKLDISPKAVKTTTALAGGPLDSEQSRSMDREILGALEDAERCHHLFAPPSGSKSLQKLYERFHSSNNLGPNCLWVIRFESDTRWLDASYGRTVKEFEPSHKSSSKESSSAVATVVKDDHIRQIADLRVRVQLLSCSIQETEKLKLLERVEQILDLMHQSTMFVNDGGYSQGQLIDEYRVTDIKTSRNSLGFLFFDTVSIMRYCVDVLMSIIKLYATHPNTQSDTAIGHCIVLSQFDWPRESQIYDFCINWLRENKPKSATPQSISASTKFTYPDFFQYICNPSIIEDFMAMLNQGYTLDIRGNSGNSSHPSFQGATGSTRGAAGAGTPSRSSKAITTRGVNKSFKEDLKVAMVAQMKSSSMLMPLETISEFIKTTLVPYLRSVMK